MTIVVSIKWIRTRSCHKTIAAHVVNLYGYGAIADKTCDAVSSIKDKKSPCSCWTLSDLLFKFFPILEIINPEMGMKNRTNKVSFALKKSIATNENSIVRGSLTISSRIDKNEICNSVTSDVILAIKSPFLFLLK